MSTAAPAPLLRTRSIRRDLLWGILLPVVVFVVYNTTSLYRQSLNALHIAYDRSLLASAKVISEQLDVHGYDELAVVSSTVPYSALEAFEADNQTRMFYRVSTLQGEMISGFAELPAWKGHIPLRPAYAALVDFYDTQFRGMPVRVAALLQPVASDTGRGMAVIQVAETLEQRESLAREILIATLIKQGLLFACIAIVVLVVVRRATQPVLQLSRQLTERSGDDLSALRIPADTPREIRPLVDATNQVMARLAHLLRHQKRFVRDASHQLRTPLAVLKTQVQSAQRGDLPAPEALAEIAATVDRATQLANQMLSLAKIEQVRQEAPAQDEDLTEILRAMVIELSPLIADKNLQFSLDAAPVQVRAHHWMLREMLRNLLHNAIQHSPPDAPLEVSLQAVAPRQARLLIRDHGTGLSPEAQARLFQPFSATTAGSQGHSGTGLGLAICHEIAQACGATIQLQNRSEHGQVAGLDTVVVFPLAAPI
ncbi:sensor histidine kinase [Comamonas humi]